MGSHVEEMPIRGGANQIYVLGARNIFNSDFLTSIDIDECDADEDDCNPNALCTNTLGSFTCTGKINFTHAQISFFLLNGIFCKLQRHTPSSSAITCMLYGQFNMHVLG